MSPHRGEDSPPSLKFPPLDGNRKRQRLLLKLFRRKTQIPVVN